jgi:hypothetical protein
MRLSTISVVVGTALLYALASRAQGQRQGQPAAGVVKEATIVKPDNDQVEDIYVAHSIRVSTVSPPTAFCTNAPFKEGTITEAHYTWSSVETKASDGRLLNSSVKIIGNIRACFGTTPDPSVLNAYSEGTIAGVPFKGIGRCDQEAPGFPEAGITTRRCFQILSGLPANYVGGVILNNSITSQNANGDLSSPRGYLQSGLATIRLWKRRL